VALAPQCRKCTATAYNEMFGRPRVGVARDRDVALAVQRALDALGGIRKFVKTGYKVLIKPNIAYNRPSPITTNKEVIATLVDFCYEAGAGDVQVGDSAAYPTKHVYGRTTEDAFEGSGIAKIVVEKGACLANFDKHEFVEMAVPNGRVLRTLKVAKSLVDVDIVINVPVLKTHHMTTVSLAMKNLQGVLSDEYKVIAHRDDLHWKLVDLVKAVKPKLTIIDGTRGMEGYGPALGTGVDLDLLIAGENTVACDAIGCLLMDIKPVCVEHLMLAAKEGLGPIKADQIDLASDFEIETLKRRFKRPEESFAEEFSEVDSIAIRKGGVCAVCNSIVQNAVIAVKRKGHIDKVGEVDILVGVNPPRSGKSSEGKMTYVVGDCACKSVSIAGKKVRHISGCPPFFFLTELRKLAEGERLT